MALVRMLPLVLIAACSGRSDLDHSSSALAYGGAMYGDGGVPPDAVVAIGDAIGDAIVDAGADSSGAGAPCDPSGTSCMDIQYSISCDEESEDCEEPAGEPGDGGVDGPDAPDGGVENPKPGIHKFSFSGTDTQTYTRSTTKAVKTSYSVQVGAVQKSGDNLVNIQTKFEQTIKGYVKIEHSIPKAEWEANGKKPLLGPGNKLNYDVTATCGAQTKLVNTSVTAEGDANAIALGFAGTLKLSASGGGLGGPDATLLGFSVGASKVETVESGKTVELSIDSSEEQTIALKVGDDPLKECQIKHFLKDAWGPNRNLMQSALDSAMAWLDAHGLKWTLTSNTAVVCKCTANVDLYGKCADFPSWLWIKNGGSEMAVVQQFDEQAILQCATFSAGDKRPATVNGLAAQVTAWNNAAHNIDNTMLKTCNDRLTAIHGPLGPRYDSAKVYKVGTDWKDRTITCAPSP